MVAARFIRTALASALFAAAGCASLHPPLEATPLGQDDLDQFLASGRDARTYGITTYQDPAGARYEFANRVHPYRSAQMPFASPAHSKIPLIRAKTGRFVNFNLLLDTSARQNWVLLPSVEAMDYRAFAPPSGEYPDHVLSDIPGYAGVANKIVMDKLHVESPVFFVPPARGGLGPLARADERPNLDEKAAQARRKLGANTHAVLGAVAMRSFSFVRFDFPNRSIRFSTDKAFAPAESTAVLASLPLRDWRGRPAVNASLGGEPILLVLDTAGEFDLSLPDGSDPAGPLVLGPLVLDDVLPTTHGEHGLPVAVPARLGLGVLSRYAVTLDFKQLKMWIEEKPQPRASESATPGEDQDNAPVQYRGITR